MLFAKPGKTQAYAMVHSSSSKSIKFARAAESTRKEGALFTETMINWK